MWFTSFVETVAKLWGIGRQVATFITVYVLPFVQKNQKPILAGVAYAELLIKELQDKDIPGDEKKKRVIEGLLEYLTNQGLLKRNDPSTSLLETIFNLAFRRATGKDL